MHLKVYLILLIYSIHLLIPFVYSYLIQKAYNFKVQVSDRENVTFSWAAERCLVTRILLVKLESVIELDVSLVRNLQLKVVATIVLS